MQKNLNSKIMQATKWSGMTEIASKLISPLVNIVLARLLTPEAFGIVATITMVISFAELFTDAGFQKYIVQHECKDDEELDQITNVAFWTNLCVSLLICLMIIVFRDSVASAVGNPKLGNSIGVASVLIIMAAFSSIQMARYKRSFDFKNLFFIRMGAALIPVVVTLPLAVVLRNYWALLIGNFASQLFMAVALTIKSKWKPSFCYSFQKLKEMFAFSAWTLLESVSIWLTSYIGVFIVGNHLNEYYLGLYKTSMSTVNSYMALITSAVIPVAFSALSRYQNDEIAFKHTYFTFQRLTAVFVLPMGIGIYIFRDCVTYLLLGSQWMEAGGFIGLWGFVSAVVIVFSYFASEVYRSKGNPQLSLVTQLIHLVFVVPTLLVCINHGFENLYIARSLIRLQSLVTAMLILRIKYGFGIMHTLHNTMPMLVSALLMGGVGFALRQVSANIIWQLVAIILCAIFYFLILLGCFPKVRNEVLSIPYARKLTSKIKKRF